MNRSGREDSQPASSPPTPPPSSTATTSAASTATAPTASAAAIKSSVPVTSTPSPLGASIHRVTSQLLTAPDDVRTPPKVRHQQESREGQGVAVPVILEEDELEHPEEVLTRRSPLHPGASASTSKPLEQGLSTWVLLSGSHEAPPSTQPSPAPKTTSPKPQTPKTTTTTAPKTTRAPPKPSAPTTKKPVTKTTPTPTPGKVRAPSTTRKPLTTPKPTPTPTTTPTTTAATASSARPKPAKNKTTDVPALAPAMTRKPPTAVQRTPATTTTTTTTTTAKATTVKEEPTTVLPIVTESPEEEPGTTTEPESKTETSTRRTRRPGNGNKKKKNKNKRRKNRPGANNATAVAESKIGETETNSTTKPQNKERPLSTRIYNYLAREVMPSFGVGLLGLAITAGLAGLIMYPFGGGAVKRTYEVDAPTLPQHGNFYYYGGEYEGEDHGQAEESVIRKVFEGMNAETDQAEDSRYANQRYPAESDAAVASGTVTTYAGDVQANRYPTHRYDTGQTYSANSGVHGSYSAGAPQGSYNRQDTASYYSTDQSGSYYAAPNAPSRETGASGAAAAAPANATDSSGGRVRYREVATGTVSDPQSPNPQQITKKSDYYGYNTGRVRFRDVGTGEVQEAPRVRFREVGSDAVHYSMSDAASGESGVEHGPRNVRVKRQLWNIKEMVKEMEREDKQLEEQARKMMDETKNMRNDVHVMHVKKNKPKKATDASTKSKPKQDEMAIPNIFHSQQDILEDEEDDMKPYPMDAGESLVVIDDLSGTKMGTTPDVVDAEFVTGSPDTTEVEVLSIDENDEKEQAMEMGMGNPGGMMAYYPIAYMGAGFNNGMSAAVINSNIGANIGDAIEAMDTEMEAIPPTTETPVATETSVTPETPVVMPQAPQVIPEAAPAKPSMPQILSDTSPQPETPASMPETSAVPEAIPETSESIPEMSATTEAVPETTETGMDDERLETTPPVTTIKSILDIPRPQLTLIDIIKKIAHLKLQLGIGLLKSTSQAFTGYLDAVQKRMEDALKEARQASYRRTNFWNFRRSKREAKKNQTKKMKRKQG